MELVISLVVTLGLVLLLRKSIKDYPVIFYAAAVVVDVLFLSGVLFGVSRDVVIVGYPYVARCLIGFSLFTIVMFVGALADENRIRRMLMPIRGELSVLACILAFGHVANYLFAYLSDIVGGFFGMSAAMIASFLVSTILIVLLVPLAVTSLETVKGKMRATSWKKLQKSAYTFYVLVYVHIVLMLAPTVSSIGQRAVLSIVIYTTIVILYVAFRVRKAVRDKRSVGSGILTLKDKRMGDTMSKKNMTRRDAVKAASLCGLSVMAAGVVFEETPAFAQQSTSSPLGDATKQYGFFMDTSNCVNCGNCITACRNYNDIPDGEADRRRVTEYEVGPKGRVYVSTSCMHCENPSCVAVCPAGAVSKGDGGIVTVDKRRCIGCKYCYEACPFGVPHYNAKGMDKCDCCRESGVVLGDSPHCVDACQYDALHYGPIEELAQRYGERAHRVVGSTMPSCYLT